MQRVSARTAVCVALTRAHEPGEHLASTPELAFGRLRVAGKALDLCSDQCVIRAAEPEPEVVEHRGGVGVDPSRILG